ncbi:hypothetical protein [Desulfonatronum thioautotrophicum]|uniref:hypothetical protein n=1 Tax=Desulfonatronum thioautotrophicum TaxID=617001 RepID=UPI0005EB2004|nr:hypothetical protein [Desulfonatronum thioautotrophicum]
MNHIFADGMSKVTFSNNNLRISLVQNGPENTVVEAGLLVIPINQSPAFVNALASSLKQLEEQIKAKKQDAEETMQ